MDQLPRLGKRELICLLLFTCNYEVSVWRGFLFLWVLGMGYVILLWHSLSLPYNYFRQSLNLKRRYYLDSLNIETLWAEVTLPNSKTFLNCTVYRPPNACSEWIDLFEKEVSVAQTTGFEFLLMGDFNIDMKSCSNNKSLNLIQLCDLSQLVKDPTR